ncbi:uncharacterized protein LOC127833419 isoform X2 [Dreissena polymorpha]|nr:uncharacterized protein LOC127833419 isoform X2 [Dreissena polymorpha]
MTGANDIGRKSPGDIGRAIESLCRHVRDLSPSATVFVSHVLPRCENRFDGSLTQDFICRWNRDAEAVNQEIEALSCSWLQPVRHPRFYDLNGPNRRLLSRDGLHLSFDGTEEVCRNMYDAVYSHKASEATPSSHERHCINTSLLYSESGGFKEGANCDMCQRIAGEVMCSPKMCAPCPLGFFLDNMNFSCAPSPPEVFKCGNGMCITLQRCCDSVIDCIDEENDCVSTPPFVPPTGATASPTLIPPMTSLYHGTHTVIPPSVTGDPTLTLGINGLIACTSKWSTWLNRDKLQYGNGDREVMTQSELAAICPADKIIAVECQAVDGMTFYSSWEVSTVLY